MQIYAVQKTRNSRSVQLFVKIYPIWIDRFNEFQFVFSRPCFNLFFSCNSRESVFILFIINKNFAVITSTESRNLVMFVLIDAFYQITGHTRIQSAVSLICHNINCRLFMLHSHPLLSHSKTELTPVFASGTKQSRELCSEPLVCFTAFAMTDDTDSSPYTRPSPRLCERQRSNPENCVPNPWFASLRSQ